MPVGGGVNQVVPLRFAHRPVSKRDNHVRTLENRERQVSYTKLSFRRTDRPEKEACGKGNRPGNAHDTTYSQSLNICFDHPQTIEMGSVGLQPYIHSTIRV